MAEDVTRLETVDQGYRQSAHAVGLMAMPGVRDERKLIMEIERERSRTEQSPSSEQEAQFLECNLRPQVSSRRGR